jgi:kynureninase
VVTDFREPDLLRLGAAPLYNSFVEVQEAMKRIRAVTAEKLYESQSNLRENVT